MYSDKDLEFAIAARDQAATETRALPLGQADMRDDTRGMEPYTGLWLVGTAGEEIPPGFVVTMKHSDTEAGAYSDIRAFPATTAATKEGKNLFPPEPLPSGLKNWVKFGLSAAKKVNIFIARDVDKTLPGMFPDVFGGAAPVPALNTGTEPGTKAEKTNDGPGTGESGADAPRG